MLQMSFLYGLSWVLLHIHPDVSDNMFEAQSDGPEITPYVERPQPHDRFEVYGTFAYRRNRIHLIHFSFCFVTSSFLLLSVNLFQFLCFIFSFSSFFFLFLFISRRSFSLYFLIILSFLIFSSSFYVLPFIFSYSKRLR
jgi:hypothetical protein